MGVQLFKGMNPSAITLSLTKVVVPALRPEILSRDRLLTRLEDLLEQKLVLITAPAGYGKTSLLIDLAHHTEMPVCWLSLDLLDRDPQRFVAYFIAMVTRRFPQFGKESATALNSLTSFDHGLENLIITLVNEIYEQISEHFVLVLDDYQHVDSVPEIRDFISRFIQLASENCHLVLSSRRLPALPDMAVLVARQQVGGFDLRELAFQLDEMRDLFQKKYGLHIPESTVQDLLLHTEGWITGINFSRPQKAQGLVDLARFTPTTGAGLPEYLDHQVLNQQTPEVREFLLQTSLFDEFNEELCAVVLGAVSPGKPHRWNKLIEAVKRNNLFVLAVGPNGKWLRYHNLVQDFLQSRLKEESPETAEAILIYLVQYYEQNSEWEKAHHLYKQLGDITGLAGLVERAGKALIQSDRLITLGNWLDELPDVITQEHPGLLSLKGALELIRGKVRFGLSLLDQATASFQAAGDEKNLGQTLVRRANAHRLLGDYKASLQDAEDALQITAQSKNPFMQACRVEALRMKGLALYRLGQMKQSTDLLQSSLSLAIKLNDTQIIPVVQSELGITHRSMGDNETAKDLYEKALAIWKERGNLTWQADILNNLGVLHHLGGDYEQAAVAFEQGLECARRSGYLRSEALLLTSLGDLYAELGEFEIARHAYEKAEDIARQIADQFLLTYSLLSQAAVARASGTFDRARLLLDEVYAPVREHNSTYEIGLFELECGRLELASRSPQRAIPHLQSAVESFSRGSRVLETGWSHLWLAAACNQAGDQQTARMHLKETAKLDGKGHHSLSMAAYQLQNWLDNSLSDDPEVRTVLVRLLRRAENLQPKLPSIRKRLRRLTSTVPMPPPHLDIRAFGKAQVRVNGKLVTNAQWQSKSVRELFFYFLHASGPLTKEQVGADLWPEVTPRQLKLRFKNNLYRLRRAVGPETILWERELYSFNRDLDYEYDVETFKAHLAKARAAKGVLERTEHYQAAVDLVNGPYLHDFESTWILPEREHLEQDYTRALLSLARLLLQIEKNEEALQICLQALSHDACLEEAYRFAMRIYDRLGDHTAVSRQYLACKKCLQAELGVAPSPETEALYRRLIT